MAESMTGLKRTCRCAELTTENISQTVTVMGWVQKSRNKGGIVFVDLRDRSGIIQLIFEESHRQLHQFDQIVRYERDIDTGRNMQQYPVS